jgi:hypothetical protein
VIQIRDRYNHVNITALQGDEQSRATIKHWAENAEDLRTREGIKPLGVAYAQLTAPFPDPPQRERCEARAVRESWAEGWYEVFKLSFKVGLMIHRLDPTEFRKLIDC